LGRFSVGAGALLWLFVAGVRAAEEPLPRHLAEKERVAGDSVDPQPQRISSELLIQFKPGTDIQEFARRRGLVLKSVLLSDPNMVVLKASSDTAAAEQFVGLRQDAAVRAAYFNLPTLNVRMAFEPNDPYFETGRPATFPGQWHLRYDARPEFDSNVRGAWNRNLTGSGVIVGICDDGVEIGHPDLAPNYLALDSYNFAENNSNPNPVANGLGPEGDNHGTSVAGVAAARGGNGVGVTGAAPLARIAALRLPFQGQNVNNQHAFVDVVKYHSFGNNRAIRVKNHSYGISAPYVSNMSERDALADSAAAGTIHVISAGNDRQKPGEDSNKKAFQTSPDAIAVAALASSGIFASYSSFGGNVAITAPSSSFRSGEFSVTTTDRSAGLGYNPSSNEGYPDQAYTSTFGGTSSAAPLVAGIMALAVQANTNLNVRMAKHLLARTSRLIDPTDASETSGGGWKTNAAGFAFNPNYGFGLIDADALTQSAPLYSGVTELETIATQTIAVNAAVPDEGQLERTFTVQATTPLEEVEVRLQVEHTFRGDLEGYLSSPQGTTSRLFIRNGADDPNNRGNLDWWFTSHAFWGENPAGTWKITLQDRFKGDTGTWRSFQARLRMGRLVPMASASPPSITGFTPASGAIGATVTISGAKFSEVNAVTFNGVSAASFTVLSSTQLSAVVPPGASSGPVGVQTANGSTASAASFQVTQGPVILSFSPPSGPVGATIQLSGANLAGATAVSFNNVNAQFTIQSAAQITAVVPAGATTGRIQVTTPIGKASSARNFEVSAAPVIISFTPAGGPIGSSVVISGANLAGTTAVHFQSTPAQFTVNSSQQITAIVPAGATTGNIRVQTPEGTVTSTGVFAVPTSPVITHFTPGNGPIGSSVVIGGANLAGATAVRFNNLNAQFTGQSSSQLTAIVPAGATSGPISVVTPSGTGTSPESFTVTTAPSNDSFGNAQVLTGASGTITGSSLGATKETGEPRHADNSGGKSVWYQWTAPASGTWIFETAGSGFDTLLAVYTGSAVTALTAIASNDDAGESVQSQITVTASPGTVYRIAVDGFNPDQQPSDGAASGAVSLKWTSLASPPVITGFSPDGGPGGTLVFIDGNHFLGATGVSFGNTDAAQFTVLSPTRLSATVAPGTGSGPVRVRTPGGTGTSTAVFNATGAPANDAFAAAQVLPGGTGTVSGTNRGATRETGEPLHGDNTGGASVWYVWTAPASGLWTFSTQGSTFDTLLAVYTGTALANLSLVTSNDDASADDRTSRVRFQATGGTVYYLAIDGYIGLIGGLQLSWDATPNAPRIASVSPGNGAPGTVVTVTGQNLSGTTAVRFGGVAAESFTVLSGTQLTAVVPANAVSGVITVITPAGQDSSATPFTLTGGPANDHFAKAQPLVGKAVLARGANRGASHEPGEPDHADSPAGKSVWYTWSAPETGTYTIETAGSSFDTTLAVYSGNRLDALALVAANDDSLTEITSAVTFRATAGGSYRLAVDGYDGDSGDILLRLFPDRESRVLYATSFEASEGFRADLPLAGQNGWVSEGDGKNGVIDLSEFGFDQAAFIGFDAPFFPESQYLWKPLDFTPQTATEPIVRFSVWMQIVDSSDFAYDEFEWSVYNRQSQRLFTINFDNSDLEVYYRLNEAGARYIPTGYEFENDVFYLLTVTMDFSRNQWSARLDQTDIISGQPISVANVPLTLGDIDAVWIQQEFPGDNFMLFDDFLVEALPDQTPSLWLQPVSQTIENGAEAFLSVVAAGGRPLQYQWLRNGRPITGATNTFLVLSGFNESVAGEYEAIIRNEFGSVSSARASLTAAPPPAPPPLLSGRFDQGRFRLSFQGAAGKLYEVQSSLDLRTWTVLGQISSPSGQLEFTDPGSGTLPLRFYRVNVP
jgi:subtilisin-like proprotein convertase family protein